MIKVASKQYNSIAVKALTKVPRYLKKIMTREGERKVLAELLLRILKILLLKTESTLLSTMQFTNISMYTIN